MTESQTVYQTATLTPNLVKTLVTDDSPKDLWVKLWQFLGIDIPVAYIEPWDFENILDMVDIAFLDILEKYPESQWDTVAIVEYEKINTPQGIVTQAKNAYLMIDLWHAVSAKIYQKMCRARHGFTLRSMTEQRSKIEQKIDDSRPIPVDVHGAMKPPKKSGWSLI